MAPKRSDVNVGTKKYPFVHVSLSRRKRLIPVLFYYLCTIAHNTNDLACMIQPHPIQLLCFVPGTLLKHSLCHYRKYRHPSFKNTSERTCDGTFQGSAVSSKNSPIMERDITPFSYFTPRHQLSTCLYTILYITALHHSYSQRWLNM
jgi:hypothetical protein